MKTKTDNKTEAKKSKLLNQSIKVMTKALKTLSILDKKAAALTSAPTVTRTKRKNTKVNQQMSLGN